MLDNYLEQIQNVDESSMYQAFGSTVIKLSKGETTVAGIAAAAAIIYMSVKAMKFLATSKECRNYKQGTPQWKICENKVLNENDNRKIKALSDKANLCNNSKNPADCKSKIQEKINSIKLKVNKRLNIIKDLQRKVTK